MIRLQMSKRSYRISIRRDEIEQYCQGTLSAFFENIGPRLPGIAVWQISDLTVAQREFTKLQALGLNVSKDW